MLKLFNSPRQGIPIEISTIVPLLPALRIMTHPATLQIIVNSFTRDPSVFFVQHLQILIILIIEEHALLGSVSWGKNGCILFLLYLNNSQQDGCTWS